MTADVAVLIVSIIAFCLAMASFILSVVVLFGTHFYCKIELKGKLDDKLKALRKKKD